MEHVVEGNPDGSRGPVRRSGGGGRPLCPDHCPGTGGSVRGQTHTARHILWYEDAVAAGGILGNLISIYQFPLPFGEAGAGIFGIFAGVFVGAWAMALTEIINIIPIFARRLDFRRGLELLIVSMALGRTAGALIFYYFGF